MLKKVIFYLVIFINTILALVFSLGEINTSISIYNNIKYSLILIVLAILVLSIMFFAINYNKDLRIDLKRYYKFVGLNFYSLSIFFILYNIFFYKYSLYLGNKAWIYILCNLFLTFYCEV
ncbi:hypothetical protein [Clostridium perfringens]|uniref:hypothetical protein n=1 Tax=Clostridium perfringens TaxID=1502 RepID=UPI0024BC1D61|nr:hypothetical protein [Clostridium perfringens]